MMPIDGEEREVVQVRGGKEVRMLSVWDDQTKRWKFKSRKQKPAPPDVELKVEEREIKPPEEKPTGAKETSIKTSEPRSKGRLSGGGFLSFVGGLSKWNH